MTLPTALPAGTYYLGTVPINAETKLGDLVPVLNPPTPIPPGPIVITDWPAQNVFNKKVNDKLDAIILMLQKSKP